MATANDVRDIMATLVSWYPGRYTVNDTVLAEWQKALASVSRAALDAALARIEERPPQYPPGVLDIRRSAEHEDAYLPTTRLPHQVGWVVSGGQWAPYLWTPEPEEEA